MKRPHIICHMAGTIDGKIDSSTMQQAMPAGDYEALHGKLGGNAWICGRTTMEQHFALKEPFVSKTNQPAGPQPVHVARTAETYAICVDTHGKLRWSGGDLHGDHLICVLSEQVATDYLEILRQQGISYIVAGAKSVDLPRAVEQLAEHFGIQTLLLEGGGHINGAFLQAGLVDEVSLLLVAAIDGRHNIAGVFDGLPAEHSQSFSLNLKSVEQRDRGGLWIRYDMVRA